MPHQTDRFLQQRTVLSRKAALGRVFSVTRETWRLADDPQRSRPRTETLVSGHTASEAADLAREFAEAEPRHGFHKPSASWWGADDTHFHRFVVHAGRRRAGAAMMLTSGLLGLAAVALIRRPRRRPVASAAEPASQETSPPR